MSLIADPSGRTFVTVVSLTLNPLIETQVDPCATDAGRAKATSVLTLGGVDTTKMVGPPVRFAIHSPAKVARLGVPLTAMSAYLADKPDPIWNWTSISDGRRASTFLPAVLDSGASTSEIPKVIVGLRCGLGLSTTALHDHRAGSTSALRYLGPCMWVSTTTRTPIRLPKHGIFDRKRGPASTHNNNNCVVLTPCATLGSR